MEWIYQTLQWYFALFCIGVVFFGITQKLFHSFFDHGYAFSKTIGLLFLSYGVFLLSNLHILPFHELTLYLLLICAIGIGYLIQRNQKKEKIHWIIFV